MIEGTTTLGPMHKDERPIRFMGSKHELLPYIEKTISRYCDHKTPLVFADLFCGTSIVSRHYKKLGHSIIANDSLTFCSMFAKASLLVSKEPHFFNLMSRHRLTKQILQNPYDAVLNYLNSLCGKKGFVFNEYSPEGSSSKEFGRKYFTKNNAIKIDAIRDEIEMWYEEKLIAREEYALLISDLLRACNKVANIAGTYGYFLKKWDPRTNKNLHLIRSSIIPSEQHHQVYNEDTDALVGNIECDILYLDPPYTWRHYGAYYHILESIAKWDKPKVYGQSGLRPWKNNSSKYCYRGQALAALDNLIDNSKATHIFLSYGSEGLMQHQDICDILSSFGKLNVCEVVYRRYKSRKASNAKTTVQERIYHVEK